MLILNICSQSKLKISALPLQRQDHCHQGFQRLPTVGSAPFLKTRKKATWTWQLKESVETVSAQPTDFGLCSVNDGLSPRVILDLRPEEMYKAGHLPGATSLPLGELERRMLELPPPFEEELWLCAETSLELETATNLLQKKNWKVARRLTALEMQKDFVLEKGGESARSWRPTRFLRYFMNSYWKSVGPDTTNSEALIALDLGCGNGRDAIFMKQRLGPKWTVVGIDNHSFALDRAAQLAKQEGLGPGSGLEWLKLDLRKPGALKQAFPVVNMVHGCRFLDRPLLLEVRDQVLKPGGLFLWSTFLEAEGNLAPPFRPSRRLIPQELAKTFDKEAGYGVIFDEEGTLITRSQPVRAQFFAAQKFMMNLE